MAITLPDFSAPRKSALDSYLEGYAGFNAPRSKNLADALMQAQTRSLDAKTAEPYSDMGRLLQDYRNLDESDTFGRQAFEQYLQSKSQNQGSPHNLTGEVGNAFRVALLEQQLGPDNELVKAAKGQLALQQQRDKDLMDYRGNLVQSRNWNSLGAAAKENTLSLARSIAPNATDGQLVEFFKNNGTFEELADQTGFDKAKIPELSRQYAATNKTISTIQQGLGAEAELDVLGKFIRESQSPYASNLIGGYSVNQIIDSFSSKPEDIDKQAKFLAGRALAEEQAAIQARLAGASNAAGALKGLKELALNRSNIIRPLVSAEVYERMQDYMNEELKKAAHARFRAMSPGRPQSSSSSGFRIIQTPDGRNVKVPDDMVEQALNAGGTLVE